MCKPSSEERATHTKLAVCIGGAATVVKCYVRSNNAVTRLSAEGYKGQLERAEELHFLLSQQRLKKDSAVEQHKVKQRVHRNVPLRNVTSGKKGPTKLKSMA